MVALVLVGLSSSAVAEEGVGRVVVDPSAPRQDGSTPRPRSVLFYLVDTCRQDRVSIDGGYERETTPFLDWLAERSVVFEACSSQAPWTKPSMASMLTSRYPRETGVYRVEHRLPAELVTWPEVMAANGLYAAGFSANIVMGNLLSDFAQGFDHFVESTAVNGGDPIRFASGSARKLNEHVFPWLERTDHWPMLLYVHSVDPHEEYEPAPEYLEQFADPARDPRYREEWQQLLESRPPIPGLYVTRDNFDRTGVDVTSFIEHGSDLYDADLLANDTELSLLWEKLRDDGWGEDLVLVVTSDHGEEFFEHGGTSHGYSLYEEMVRVPLLIHAPGLLPEGKRIDTPVSCLDIYPTLCQLLGFDVPEGLRGRSLLPLIHGEGASEEVEIFSEHREDPLLRRLGHGSGVMTSVRSSRWKLIVNEVLPQLVERPRHELFDLVADPGEQHDVAAANPGVVARLEQRLASFTAHHPAAGTAAAGAELDPEVLAQLRELGYVGEEASGPDLWAALAAEDPERVRRCLEAGADPDGHDELLHATPLFMTVVTGNVPLAKLLLEGGAEVDGRNLDGSTVLHGAALFGLDEMVMLLLDHGADPEARNARGDSVLGATLCPWALTEFLADLLQVEPVDRDTVEAGRRKCAERLRARIEEQDG